MRGLLLAIAVGAGSALLIAPAPAYDPWAWLLWGRELTQGTLSTAEGPAFKPGPVAVCALLAPLGEAAVWIWVAGVRAATAVAAWLAFRAGARMAGGSPWAGAAAAAGVLLCGALPTYAATGAETPLVLAGALAGAEAWRRGRPGAALACGVACAGLRVEAWPFLLLFGAVLWRRRAVDRRWLALLVFAVPAAWFVPEWLASGEPLRSGARARVPNPGQPALADVPALASLRVAAGLVLLPLLGGAAYAVARRMRPAGGWAGAGVAWVAIVAGMAQAGFSGEPRYAVPGAAVIAVAGAAGLGAAVRRSARPVLAALCVWGLVAVAAVPRLADAARIPGAQSHQWQLASRLDDAIAAAGGRSAVLACGTVHVGRLRGPLMAHRLRVEKRRIEPDAPPRAPGVVFRSRLTRSAPLEPRVPPGFATRAARGPWTVHANCGVRVP